MKKIYISILLVLIYSSVNAQLNPFTAQYFNNRYLGNAAYGGRTEGLNANMNYLKQWTNIPGSPEIQNIALDYGFGKVGLGLNVTLEKTGLQRQNKFVGTYAYHLPINDYGDRLSFGLSLGFMNQRLSNSEISGNIDDPLVASYNERETYMDGGFGVVYTRDQLSLEASLPNLNFLFNQSILRTANIPIFYTAASYKFVLIGRTDDVTIEPRLAFRGIKGFDNIVDIGTNVTFLDSQLMMMAMYHSSKSLSFGAGADIDKKYLVSCAYTISTSQIGNYANGNFEINLRIKLGERE